MPMVQCRHNGGDARLPTEAVQETWPSTEQHLKQFDLLLTMRQNILLALVLVSDALQNSV